MIQDTSIDNKKPTTDTIINLIKVSRCMLSEKLQTVLIIYDIIVAPQKAIPFAKIGTIIKNFIAKTAIEACIQVTNNPVNTNLKTLFNSAESTSLNIFKSV